MRRRGCGRSAADSPGARSFVRDADAHGRQAFYASADLADPSAPAQWISTLASAHVCASIPNFFRCEFMFNDVPWRDTVISHPLDVREGHLHLSDRPGLGVDLVEEELEKHPGIRQMDARTNFYV